MSKTKWSQDTAIRGALRRVFSRSPVVREVLMKNRREVPKYRKDGTRAKRDAVQYQCNLCNEWVGSTKIAVDHIEPVISVDEGFIDFNTFIERLFCDADNLQPICETCHRLKTNAERIARLVKQYSAELDSLESGIQAKTIPAKEAKEKLRKYISKKKTDGLKGIADRATKLREQLNKSK